MKVRGRGERVVVEGGCCSEGDEGEFCGTRGKKSVSVRNKGRDLFGSQEIRDRREKEDGIVCNNDAARAHPALFPP